MVLSRVRGLLKARMVILKILKLRIKLNQNSRSII